MYKIITLSFPFLNTYIYMYINIDHVIIVKIALKIAFLPIQLKWLITIIHEEEARKLVLGCTSPLQRTRITDFLRPRAVSGVVARRILASSHRMRRSPLDTGRARVPGGMKSAAGSAGGCTAGIHASRED